jgi:hypothetical protein
VEYPTHVVMTNIVKWFSATSILSEAFVFTENHINNGKAAYSVGMENAFHARYQWEKDEPIFDLIGPETLQSFPYNNCYSHGNWDLLVQVSTLINRELTRSFIAQHTSKKIHLFLTKAEFQYLKERMMPDILVYTKKGCQRINSHGSAPLEKVLNNDQRRSTSEWTLPRSSRSCNVFLEVLSCSDSGLAHLVLNLFSLQTTTKGALFWPG